MAVLATILVGILFFIGWICLSTVILVLTWNHVMPYLFHLPTLDWTQAFCLSWVFTTLIKPVSYPKQSD